MNEKLNITVDQLTSVVCEKCKGEVFTEGVILRELSALLSKDGNPKLAPVPVFICSGCKEVLWKYVPEKLRPNQIKLVQ